MKKNLLKMLKKEYKRTKNAGATTTPTKHILRKVYLILSWVLRLMGGHRDGAVIPMIAAHANYVILFCLFVSLLFTTSASCIFIYLWWSTSISTLTTLPLHTRPLLLRLYNVGLFYGLIKSNKTPLDIHIRTFIRKDIGYSRSELVLWHDELNTQSPVSECV